MKTSQETKDIFSAISMAQSQFTSALKDSLNPFFKSHYADISSIIQSIKPALGKNGLAIMQPLSSVGDKHFISTLITHSSGQFIEFDPVELFIKDKSDPQKFKSSVTYFRRTCLVSVLGIEEEDDDGNSSANNEVPQPKKTQSADAGNVLRVDPKEPKERPSPLSVGGVLSEAQIKRLWAMSYKLNLSKQDVFSALKKRFNKGTPEELGWKEYQEYTESLQGEISKTETKR
jgi:hypothetical protein